MSKSNLRRFVTSDELIRIPGPWTVDEWLCRPDLVTADKLLLVRAIMQPGYCHPFHFHPHREEIIHVLSGRAEQWVNQDYRILNPGETAHIQPGVIHGTYNPHDEPLIFLAILSPANLPEEQAKDPDPHDVGTEEPWCSIRKSNGLKPCRWGEGKIA